MNCQDCGAEDAELVVDPYAEDVLDTIEYVWVVRRVLQKSHG